jgi:hypothetical protein
MGHLAGGPGAEGQQAGVRCVAGEEEEMGEEIELTREFKMRPAYDKRPDYGIHGAEMLFYVKGPKGAIQFVVCTNWQLPNVRQETDTRTLILAQFGAVGANPNRLQGELRKAGMDSAANSLEKASRCLGMRESRLDQIHLEVSYHPFASDIGYHSPVPMYEGQDPMSEKCTLLDGTCYYDGSTLNAGPILELLIAEGTEALWAKLEEEYHYRFDSKEVKP